MIKNLNHVKNEIMYRIKSDVSLVPDINLELLLKCVESDVIFYLPDPNIFFEFLKNYCSIIISKYKNINKIYVVVEDNFIDKSKMYNKISNGNIIVVRSDDFSKPECNSVVVFDDLKNISNFYEFNSSKEKELDFYIQKFGFTTSPFFFYDIYTSTDSNYGVYTPILFGQQIRWFYKKSLENTEIVLYKKVEEELYTNTKNGEINQILVCLSKIINKLKSSEIDEERNFGNRMMFLLCNGLFKTNFVVEILLKDEKYISLKEEIVMLQFTSDKLLNVFNEIMKSNEYNINILFSSYEVLEVVYTIFKYEISNTNCAKNLKFSDDKKEIEIQSLKRLKFLNYCDLSQNSIPDLFICYDYQPVHFNIKKMILYPESKKELFYNIKTFEYKIENEIRKTLKIPDMLFNTNKNPDFSKQFVIKVHSKDNLDERNIDNENLFRINDFDISKKIIYLEKQHNFSFVGFRIQENLKEALEFDFIKPNNDTISLLSENIEIGNIIDKKTWTNGHKIISPSFIFFKRDVIVVYCFNKDFNLKIKISVSCMEDFIFVEKNEYILNFYLCLNRKPKIYLAQNINSITKKWNSIFNMRSKERYDLCESAIWNRSSIEDVPFIQGRDDIKISFNLRNNPDHNKIKDIIVRNRLKMKDTRFAYNKSIEELEKRKIKLYDVIDCVISFFTRFTKIKMLFTKFDIKISNRLSTKQIYEYFGNCSFEDFFYIMCLVSQKERYISYNLTEEDCKIISESNIFSIVNYLLGVINKRFTDISEKIRNFTDNINEVQPKKIRQVIITPLTIIYKMPVSFESNRILREFDYEKFLRVSLREEDFKTKIRDTACKDQNCIYNYYRNILNDGLFMGPRKYFFVAMTTSQMKLHNAWFLTPYFSNNILIGPDYIRNWLGDFSEIKNIGKYAMRLGQALSSTIPTIDIDNFIEIEDNIKNNFNFSDGVGVISFSYAVILSEKLGLDHVPSAFQIRFGGYKGVIVAHPINEEDIELYKKFNIDIQICQGVSNLLLRERNLNSKRKKIDEEIEFGSKNNLIDGLGNTKDSDIVLVLRKSMRKFNSKHRNMECITHSSCNPCYLNRQIINLLEGLGISISTFLEHQDNYLINILSEMYSNPIKYVRKFYGGLPLKSNVQDLKIFKKLLIQISNKIARDLYKKNKILIENGAVLMGTLDELMVLKENEVYIKVKKNLVGKYNNFIEDGEYVIVIGPTIIMKNPCLHPGDIRLVYGVNKPELSFMRDVLVFNQIGERPIPNMCSGSDLDGDMYTVIWEKTLIPKYFHEPSFYEDQTFLSKEIVCLKDIVNFYIRYIRNYHLGSIAHAHMVYCDLFDVKSENAKLLAELFNKSIDFPRTGFIASVPESLVPVSYPDFIQIRGNVYPSYKSLGILFRRSFFTIMNTNLKCECKDCLKRYINGLHKVQKIIFQGSSIKYKSIQFKNLDNQENNSEKVYFDGFKKELNIMMNKYGFKKEDDILLQFYPENDEQIYENLMIDCKKFYNKHKGDIKKKNLNLNFLLKKSEDCTENINSLPLSFTDHEGYNFVYKNLFDISRNIKNSDFIYNSKISINEVNISEGKEEIINNDDFLNFNLQDKSTNIYKNIIKNDKIQAFTDILIYKKFIKNINRELDEPFSEIFNLLFLIDFFDSKSFDLVLVFFLYLQSQIKSFDKLEISKVLLKISRKFYEDPTDETLIYFIHKEICKQSNDNFYLVNYKDKYFNIKNKSDEGNLNHTKNINTKDKCNEGNLNHTKNINTKDKCNEGNINYTKNINTKDKCNEENLNHTKNINIKDKCNEENLNYLEKFNTKNKSEQENINYIKNFNIKNEYNDNEENIKFIIDKLARTLSTIAYLLVFDINLVQKYISMKESNEENNQKNTITQIYKKKSGSGDIIIKGMFDTSDELKLELYNGIKHSIHKDVNVFSPRLMNKGFCEMETHKINVKEFFINSYFNCLYSRIQKTEKQNAESKNSFNDINVIDNYNSKDINVIDNYNSKDINNINNYNSKDINPHLITITILPGKFYIYDVPNNFLNEILTIEYLSSSLQFYKRMYNEDNKTYLKGYFFNTNELIDEETREEYMLKKNIIFKNSTTLYTFSIVYNNVRYQIYYEFIKDNFIIKFITKGRCVAGKVFVINDDNNKTKLDINNESDKNKYNTNVDNYNNNKLDKDVSFEILYEEIIMKDNFKNMTNEESKIFNINLLTKQGDTFLVSKTLTNCKNFRLEVDIKLSIEGNNNLELINRKIFTGSRDIFTLECCHKRLVVSSTTTNDNKSVSDVNQFIKLFDNSWDNFVRYYT